EADAAGARRAGPARCRPARTPPGGAVTVDEVQKFQGGRSAMVRALGVGIVMLAITFAWMVKDPRTTLFSYLVAFVYWAGLGLGGLILLMIFHAFHAKWMVV